MTILIASPAMVTPLPASVTPPLAIRAMPGLLAWITPSPQNVVKDAAGIVQGIAARAGSLTGITRGGGSPQIVVPAGEKYDWLDITDRGDPADAFQAAGLTFDPAAGMTLAILARTTINGPFFGLKVPGAAESAFTVTMSLNGSVNVYGQSGSGQQGPGTGATDKPYLHIIRLKGERAVINVGAMQSAEKTLTVPATTGGRLSIGSEDVGGPKAWKGWTGVAAEMWLFSRWIADAEVQKLKDYVTAVYGASYV